MRAAVYARMSTSKQSADSPADQVARCREFAASRGWRVVEELVVVEAGVSGGSRHNRPGLLRLVERVAEWDVLLCFDFSRLTRDGEDAGWLRNRLRAARRNAVEVTTGRDLFDLGSRVVGILNEEYLAKLREDTRRGLRGQVERGCFAGGTPYGFRSVHHETGDGRKNAELVVEPEQASVVRRIFSEFVSGASLRAIASGLNAEGVAPPRPRGSSLDGGGWAVSSVRALLLNELYMGRYVWNRSEWVKDHETGRRRRFERPESEWIVHEAPGLAIVSPLLWERARQVREARGRGVARASDGRLLAGPVGRRSAQARYLLSGFLACGPCGGGFYRADARGWYVCGTRRDRGPSVCGSALRVRQSDLEGRILGAIQSDILVPEHVGYALAKALELARERAAGYDAAPDRRRLAEIEAERGRVVALLARRGGLAAAEAELDRLDAEEARVRARLAEAGQGPAFDPEALREPLAARLSDLRSWLAGSLEDGRRALAELLAGDRLRVSPDAARGFRVEGLVRLSLGSESPRASEGAGGFGQGVAGGRFARDEAGMAALVLPLVA